MGDVEQEDGQKQRAHRRIGGDLLEGPEWVGPFPVKNLSVFVLQRFGSMK